MAPSVLAEEQFKPASRLLYALKHRNLGYHPLCSASGKTPKESVGRISSSH